MDNQVLGELEVAIEVDMDGPVVGALVTRNQIAGVLQHSEVGRCVDEVFAACQSCLILMCYDHFTKDYNSCQEHNMNHTSFPELANSCLKDFAPDNNNNRQDDTSKESETENTEIYCPSGESRSPICKKKKKAIKKRKVNSDLRLQGKTYIGYSRSCSGIINHNVTREKKCLSERCQHKVNNKNSSRSFNCGQVSEKARQHMFHQYWAFKTWGEKKTFIRALVATRGVIRRRKNSNRLENKKNNKKQLHDCFLRNDEGFKVRVCKNFFLGTLGLGADQFRCWSCSSLSSSSDSDTESNCENEHKAITNKISRRDPRRQDVVNWLNMIPKVPSHYCRSSSSKTYVENTFRSFSHMHTVYSEYQTSQTSQRQPVGRHVFVDVMKEMNMDIHQPRKDQCDVCCSFKTGNIMKQEYDDHVIKKNEAYAAKEIAKKIVDSETVVVTMDLQSVLLSPRLQASSAYYKQKLQIHNFTVYRVNDRHVDLYVWHEGNGGVTANEFVSCVIDYIKSLPANTKKVILISDGCGYQNRNRVLSSALSDVARISKMAIEQLILEKGHTMMEADSVHSTLEQVIK